MAKDVLQETTASEACRDTIEMPELLEQILSHLPMRQLLLAQSVCQRWRCIIEESYLLQQLLFLKPSPHSGLLWIDWRYDRQDMYRNALGEPLMPENDTIQQYAPHWGKTRHDSGKYRVFINPLLAERMRVLTDVVLHGRVHSNTKGMEYSEASWRKMLITQPAVSTMVVENERTENAAHWSDSRGWSVFPVDCRGPDGMTGDDLERIFRRLHGVSWLKGRKHMEKFEGRQSLASVLKGNEE